MTDFERWANLRPLMVFLAISIAVGGVGGAAAQSGEAPPKPPAAADDESKKEAPAPGAISVSKGQAPSNATPSGGLKVVKDPETGKLRGPDRAEAAKLGGQATNRSIVGLRAVQRPNGVTVVDLEGRFQSYSVATRNQDGDIEIECRNTSPEHSHAEHSTSTRHQNSTEADMASDSPVKSNGK